MFDASRKSGLLDLPQPDRVEQPHKVARTGTRKLRLILDFGIELACGVPKQAERALTASVIPDARRHDTAPPSDARHFADSHDGVCHKVNNELREGAVERLAREWQLLRGGKSHVHPGVAVPSRRDEGF